jgi:hypothetical protein
MCTFPVETHLLGKTGDIAGKLELGWIKFNFVSVDEFRGDFGEDFLGDCWTLDEGLEHVIFDS